MCSGNTEMPKWKTRYDTIKVGDKVRVIRNITNTGLYLGYEEGIILTIKQIHNVGSYNHCPSLQAYTVEESNGHIIYKEMIQKI